MTDSRVVYIGPRGRSAANPESPQVLAAFAHALNRIPARPAGYSACVAHLQEEPSRVVAQPLALRSLQRFRDVLFHAPGRELEMRVLWRESLAAAFYARLLATELREDAPLAAGAALLHRLGEVLALRALADAEFNAGQRLLGPVLQEVTAAQNEPLANRAMSLWTLSDELRALLLQWRAADVLTAGCGLARCLSLAQLLAFEQVHAGRATPGVVESACDQAQLPMALLETVRCAAPAIDAVLLRAASPMGPVSLGRQ